MRSTREEQALEEPEIPEPEEKDLGAEVLYTLVAVAILVAIYGGLWFGLSRPGVDLKGGPVAAAHVTEPVTRQICGEPPEDGRPVVVVMLYSESIAPWINEAADRFARLCPNILVEPKAMGDIESADAILAGRENPALWSPSDELIVRYLEFLAKDKGGEAVVHIGEEVSIARSPLVVLTWEGQERVLDALTPAIAGDGPWASMACAQVPRDPDLSQIELEDMVPGRWTDWYGAHAPPLPNPPLPKKKPPPAAQKASDAARKGATPLPLDQLESWGHVKFGHPSPSRSAAGFEALYLMAYDYAFPPRERPAASVRVSAGAGPAAPADTRTEGRIEGSEHLRDELQRRFSERKGALQRWIQRCEAGLGDIPRSSEQMTAAMYKHGPSEYDFVATYEHLVFSQLGKSNHNESSMPELRVRYPQPTIVNRYPIVSLLSEAPENAAVRQASQRWIDFLRSDDMQKLAIEHGLRPATDTVKIRDYRVPANPFLRAQQSGVSFNETLTEPPRLDGKAVRELITLWQDATSRH
jgi:hypothetical protein